MAVYAEIYRRLCADFSDFPNPQQTARELLCFAAGLSPERLPLAGREEASAEAEEKIFSLAKRCRAGEPLPYLLGEWDFYGLTLTLTRDVLIPRPDTELLASRAIRFLGEREGELLDLCSGSGCIGLAIASRCPRVRVLLGELSDAALAVSRENIVRCGLAERVRAEKLDALLPPTEKRKFSCIVCNPPYIPHSSIASLDVSVRDYEPHSALDGGEDGLLFYRTIPQNWKDSLLSGGAMLFEVGIGQAEAVAEELRRAGFSSIETERDGNGILRVVSGINLTR